ncbi:hypothetical protein QIW31_01140 [Francisellaceae bacterium CB299]
MANRDLSIIETIGLIVPYKQTRWLSGAEASFFEFTANISTG